MTSDEAMQKALDWADGRLSNQNIFMDMESRNALGPEDGARQTTLVRVAQADAAEVQKWSAIAVALKQFEIADAKHLQEMHRG